MITRNNSQARTTDLYDYRVNLEEDQSVRSLKLLFGAFSTESSSAVGAWFLLQPNEKEQREGPAVGEGGQNSPLGEVQLPEEIPMSAAAGGEP